MPGNVWKRLPLRAPLWAAVSEKTSASEVRLDLNQLQSDYQSDALPSELRSNRRHSPPARLRAQEQAGTGFAGQCEVAVPFTMGVRFRARCTGSPDISRRRNSARPRGRGTNGAHGVSRTRIFTSDYGSPVRSRRRVRAHGTTSGSRSRVSALRGPRPGPLDDGGVVACWLRTAESNRANLRLTDGAVHLARPCPE